MQSFPQQKQGLLQKRVPVAWWLLEPPPELMEWLSRPAWPVLLASRSSTESSLTAWQEPLLKPLWLPERRGTPKLRTLLELLQLPGLSSLPELPYWHSWQARPIRRGPRGAWPC